MDCKIGIEDYLRLVFADVGSLGHGRCKVSHLRESRIPAFDSLCVSRPCALQPPELCALHLRCALVKDPDASQGCLYTLRPNAWAEIETALVWTQCLAGCRTRACKRTWGLANRKPEARTKEGGHQCTAARTASNYLQFLRRYVDFLLLLWSGSALELSAIADSWHPSLKFDLSGDGNVHFLDVALHIEHNR